MQLEQAKKRILVLRYRFVGDTILTVPFLRNLRRAEPDAYIAWVVAPGTADVVKGIPYVDELIVWDPVTIHADSRGTHRTLSSKIAYIRDLRARQFDKVYVLKRSLSSAIMALLTGARERIGFGTEGRGFLLTKNVPYVHERHEVLNFLEVLRVDGVSVKDDNLEYWTTAEEDASADQILAGLSGEKLLAIHPFASMPGKSWPLENFALAAQQLQEQLGYIPVILGAPRDIPLLDPYRYLFPEKTLDLVGKCSLRVTMAVIKKCEQFIGNDSGIMHLAAAAGIPLVAIFGPTSPQRFGPWGKRAVVVHSKYPCSPCRQKFFQECDPSPRNRPACIEAVTVDEVVEMCGRFLNSESTP